MRFSRKSTVILLFVSVFVLSIALVGCGGTTPAGDGSEPVELITNSVWPPNNHISEGLEEFAARVEEASDGNLILTVQSGGALGYDGPELLKVVRDGLVPVSSILTSGVAGDEPICNIVTLPFLVQGLEEAKILNDIAHPYFEKVLEEKWNQKLLYIAPWSPAGMWTKKPIESISDMKGLKTRTYDKNGGLVMEAVGGTPYPLPFSEVYSSLATGVIDSVMTSTPTAVDAKFWEVLNYYAPISVTIATELVTINLDTFNSLDEEIQDALLTVGQEFEEELWVAIVDLDKELEQISLDNGIERVDPSQEFLDDLAVVTEEIRNDWLATAPAEAQEIVEKFLEEVGR